jgi:predicted ATPase
MKIHWDEEHLKALLRLPRFPPRLLQQEPWQTWIVERGGTSEIYAYLRTCLLPSAQQNLLELLLPRQFSSSQGYADALGVSAPTYFTYLRQLIPDLLTHLNDWQAEASPAQKRLRSNLPAPLNAFVGAEKMVQAVCNLLRQPHVRLVTLTGPGGVGKTRLALQSAAQLQENFPDGVFNIALEHLDHADGVLLRLAQELRIKQIENQPLRDLVMLHLHEAQMLLVFDNFEQITAAAAAITGLLMAAPQVKALVTSQSAMHVYGEHEVRIPPLTLPDPLQGVSAARLAQSDAVRLFVERARAVQPDFSLTDANAPIIAQICIQLDGLPLAIELAAARMQVYAPQQILALLNNRLGLLTEGPLDVPTRHRTLRAAIEWSYHLLDAQERRLFRRLAVFVNGFTAEAGAIVGAIALPTGSLAHDKANPSPFSPRSDTPTESVNPGLTRLVQKSLLQTDTRQVRFAMLQTIREYALERLKESGEWEDAGRAHAHYFLHWLDGLENIQPTARPGLLIAEGDNLRTAFRWMIDQQEKEKALQFIVHLWRDWEFLANPQEIAWSEALLANCRNMMTKRRLDALLGLGWLYYNRVDLERAAALFDEALALARQLNNISSISAALHGTGELAHIRGDDATAMTMFRESLLLAEELGEPISIAWSVCHLANMASLKSEIQPAIQMYERALALFRHRENAQGIIVTLLNLGRLFLERQEYARATAMFDEAQKLAIQVDDRASRSRAQFNLGLIALKQNNLDIATQGFRNGLQVALEHGLWRSILDFIEGLTIIATLKGQTQQAARLVGALQQHRQAMNLPMHPLGRPDFEQTMRQLRRKLGDAAFEKLAREGNAWTLEQTVQAAFVSYQ